MWFRRPSRTPETDPESTAQQSVLQPWGKATYLLPHHLPLCIEGHPETLRLAAVSLLTAAQQQAIPIFLQEGPNSQVRHWTEFQVPTHRHLPPFMVGTTGETVHQTIQEVMEWVARTERPASPWPVLLVSSQLSAHRSTLLKVVAEVNATEVDAAHSARLGLIYLQATSRPPLDRTKFAAQLSCHEDGRAVLRRYQDYQSLRLPTTTTSSRQPTAS